MRKYCVTLAILVALTGYGNVQAGLVTGLLSGDNTKNDQIQDRSLGYVMDIDGSGGVNSNDIGWGLIRVDKINNTNVNNRAWMVYAAQITSSPSPFTHTFVPQGDAYSLASILGGTLGSQIDYSSGGPIAVLIEAPSAVSFTGLDFDGSTNSLSPSALISQIQSNFSSAQLIAVVGLATGNDYYKLEGSNPLTQLGEFSILQSFVGPVTDWKSLLDPFPLDGQDWTDNQAAIKPGSIEALTYHSDSDGKYFKTADSGTYHVNYVPEPASMIGLASLALAGAGLGFVRRRKA